MESDAIIIYQELMSTPLPFCYNQAAIVVWANGVCGNASLCSASPAGRRSAANMTKATRT